jgi:hypothetical protein
MAILWLSRRHRIADRQTRSTRSLTPLLDPKTIYNYIRFGSLKLNGCGLPPDRDRGRY